MIEMRPTVSVVMACYNSLPFLDEAIQSVLDQTFPDWELMAVDDRSTDGTLIRLREWADQDDRIRVFEAAQNSGAGAARDLAIQQAQGTFIAIFDADDICEPDRFKRQLAFLKTRPDVVAVGTQTVLVDEAGLPAGTKTFPVDPDELYRIMYTSIPIQLPTLMVNASLLPSGFDWFEGWRYSEDTLLFFKLAHCGRLANLPDFLLRYRYYPQSTSYRKAKTYFYETWRARGIARRLYGYRPSLRARLVSGLQFLVVSCLPGRCIPWVYKSIRRFMLNLSGHNEK